MQRPTRNQILSSNLDQRIAELEANIREMETQKEQHETRRDLLRIRGLHNWLNRDHAGIRRIAPSATIKNPSGVPVALARFGLALIEYVNDGVGLRSEDGHSTIEIDHAVFQAAFEEMKLNAAVMDRAKDAPLYGCVDAVTRQMIISSIFPLDNPDFNDNWRFVYYGMDKDRAIQAIHSSKWL